MGHDHLLSVVALLLAAKDLALVELLPFGHFLPNVAQVGLLLVSQALLQ